MARGYDPRRTDSSEFQEGLSAASEREQQRLAEAQAKRIQEEARDREYAEDLDSQNNQQRQESKLVSAAKNVANEGFKRLRNKLLKRVTKSIARSVLVSPYFWMGVAIIFLIVGLAMIFIMTTYIACKDPATLAGGGWKGKAIVFFAKLQADIISPGTRAYFEREICYFYGEGSTATQGTQPPTGDAPPPGQGLVAITGVPTAGSLDPRLRPCMLAHVQLVYREAQRLGISFVITSAYRPGAIVQGTNRTSSHGRGEAIDLEIIPRGSLSDEAFQKKIRTLRGLFESDGFREPMGNTLDEYNEPTEGASGGHLHVEYNSPVNGKSYCTNPVNYDT
jgi:hypothetical protein